MKCRPIDDMKCESHALRQDRPRPPSLGPSPYLLISPIEICEHERNSAAHTHMATLATAGSDGRGRGDNDGGDGDSDVQLTRDVLSNILLYNSFGVTQRLNTVASGWTLRYSKAFCILAMFHLLIGHMCNQPS